MIDPSRRNSFESFTLLLRSMSDIDYQKRVWLRGEGPEVDSYCEFVNNFYSDFQYLFRESETYNLTKAQTKQLQKLYDEFDKFKHTYYDEYEFIDSPEWKEMRELTAETLKVLKANE